MLKNIFIPCVAFVAFVTIEIAASTFAVAQVNPDYASWAQYSIGTSVTTRQISKGSGYTSDVSLTRTLIEKSAEKVVIELVMKSPSGAPQLAPSKIEIKAQMQPERGRGGRGPEEKVKESQETITVSGKQYQAKVTEIIRDESGQIVTNKTWISAQFPGRTIKSMNRIDGPVSTETTSEATEAVIKPNP